MKYYDFGVVASSLKSKNLCLAIIDSEVVFGIEHRKIPFYLDKFLVKEPIKVEACYYKNEADTIERDLVSAGNPQVVSEEFKKLVEDLDPEAAQFFETESVNCRTQKKYYVMHVTKVIHCLDESRSKIFDMGDRRSIAVGMVDVSKIGEKDHIFRLGEDVQIHYVSEKFYKEWKKRKLLGCLFNLRS